MIDQSAQRIPTTLRREPVPRIHQRNLEVFYEPNLRLSRSRGYQGYNAGYAEKIGHGTFDQHQKDLVWKLLGDVPIGPDSTVVDVGCGIGGPSGWIFERYQPARVIGIDYCPSSIRSAERRWTGSSRRPDFLQGDSQNLPLADGSVDVIFNLESALHYPDKPRFIAECKRALKPGGFLCLGDICTPHKRLFSVLAMLNHLTSQFSTQERLWSAADYRSTFDSLGFCDIRHEEVTRQSADSLNNGLAEIAKGGWRAARGFRRRFFYLCFVEKLLRRRWLTYDLFAMARP